MKKLLALLIACAALTCTFSSCGDEDSDKSDKETKSASESVSDESGDEDSKKDDKDDSEDETEAETEKETEAETEDNSEDTTGSTIGAMSASDIDLGDPIAITTDDIVGKWECYALITGDEACIGEINMGVPLAALARFTFKDDDTFEGSSAIDPDNTNEGTWRINGDEIELSSGNEILSGTFDGKYLTFAEFNEAATQTVVLVHVDEFTEFDYDAWLEEMMNSYTGD